MQLGELWVTEPWVVDAAWAPFGAHRCRINRPCTDPDAAWEALRRKKEPINGPSVELDAAIGLVAVVSAEPSVLGEVRGNEVAANRKNARPRVHRWSEPPPNRSVY